MQSFKRVVVCCVEIRLLATVGWSFAGDTAEWDRLLDALLGVTSLEVELKPLVGIEFTAAKTWLGSWCTWCVKNAFGDILVNDDHLA